MTDAMRARRCAAFRPKICAMNSRFSATVRSSHSENFCVMYPSRWRRRSASRGISSPSTVAVPEVGRNRPQSMRMVVDLPEPLGPRNP